MKRLFISSILLGLLTINIHAESNNTKKTDITKEHNQSIKTEKKQESKKPAARSKLTEQQVKEQMEREKKYAKEQSFAQGDDYDLKAVEVNKDSLDSIPVIEPDYDFDITDVYRDDL